MVRPNIVLILTDQQRFDTIHAAGNPVIRTPQLDRLAREGVLFANAFTPSPVCISARCSLIHGQYAHRTGCVDNGFPMPEDRLTFMQALTEAGYRTHGIGKMHFTPDGRALRGFQTRERQSEIPPVELDDDYCQFVRDSGYEHVFDPGGVRGEMYYIPQVSQLPARLHPTQWVGDRAVEFLRTAEADQPFFLWASFLHPHPPFSPPTPWNKLYRAPLMPMPKRPPHAEELWTYVNRFQNRGKGRGDGVDHELLRTIKAYYYACISFVDWQVGRILQALEERGHLEDTLILFTSDHGEFLGDYGCVGKRSMLDVASRVPMIVRYPGRYAAGQVCETPASLVDVMPSLLAAADIDPGDAALQGMDLAELAVGAAPDRTVYGQFAQQGQGIYMAVNRSWKYFYAATDRKEYLIDRALDPEETQNRAAVWFCQGALQQMRRQLIDYLRGEGYAEPLDGDGWKEYPPPPPVETTVRHYRDRGDHFVVIPGYTD